MNLDIVVRAFRRHHYMKDGPAYESLLQAARATGDTWRVPQAELARWWEARQAAALELVPGGGPGSHELRCGLEGTVVEVDGRELRPLPSRIEATGDRWPTHDPALPHPAFLREILGHLGMAHVRPAGPGQPFEVGGAELHGLIEELHAHALQHQRFEPALLERVRAALRAAHHAAGLPELRLWHWPHLDGTTYRSALSVRYDVDKAIVNMPAIHELEDRYGLRSTAYLRPMGYFYGRRAIRRYARRSGDHELALHGEFVSTAEAEFGDEDAAARGEKARLEEFLGRPVEGVCMHGGELRTNTTPRTRDAVEGAGFLYETMYRNRCYLPLHLPHGDGVRRTLSIGQHYADISVPLDPSFTTILEGKFQEHFEASRAAAGVFVPVMHPLYFGVGSYLSHPENAYRIAIFLPRFFLTAARLKRGQVYANS